MRNGTFYLNNGKKDQRTWITKSGKEVTRTVIYYESFGNFGSCVISYKGKKISVLADSVLED
jgi:hypothetical protein